MKNREPKPKTVKYRKSDRAWYEKNRDKLLERARSKYKENKAEINAKHREYYHKNKKSLNRQFIEKYREQRKLFLVMYGGKCVCCGETEERFLTLEHIHAQRNRPKGSKRESGANAYRKAVKKLDTSKYTILCNNCNFAERYGEPCPHKLKKKGELD